MLLSEICYKLVEKKANKVGIEAVIVDSLVDLAQKGETKLTLVGIKESTIEALKSEGFVVEEIEKTTETNTVKVKWDSIG